MSLYDELGVPESATADEIHRAYRQLARKHHPDHFPENSPARSDAEIRMRRLNEVHERLSDPVSRAAYDAELSWLQYVQSAAAVPPAVKPWYLTRTAAWVASLAGIIITAFGITLFSDWGDSDGPGLPPAGGSGAATADAAESGVSAPAPSSLRRSAANRGDAAGTEASQRRPSSGASPAARAPLAPPPRFAAQRPAILLPPAENPPQLQPATALSSKEPGPPAPSAELLRQIATSSIPAVAPAAAPSANAAGADLPRNRFVGDWIFNARNAPPTSLPFAAEFVELAIRVEKSGGFSGRFRGRYRVQSSTLKPNVQFRFEGPESGFSQGFAWRSESGAEGMIRLHLLSDNELEVGWYATRFSTTPELTSGTAILTADRR